MDYKMQLQAWDILGQVQALAEHLEMVVMQLDLDAEVVVVLVQDHLLTKAEKGYGEVAAGATEEYGTMDNQILHKCRVGTVL
jgi:hypothetical protein